MTAPLDTHTIRVDRTTIYSEVCHNVSERFQDLRADVSDNDTGRETPRHGIDVSSVHHRRTVRKPYTRKITGIGLVL